jgi:hypothetical protein
MDKATGTQVAGMNIIVSCDSSNEGGIDNMETPLLLIAALAATGLILVVIPVGIDAYRRFRYTKVIVCPGTHQMAEVAPNAWDATLKTILAKMPTPRVRRCSLWPARKGCDEKCVMENWPIR